MTISVCPCRRKPLQRNSLRQPSPHMSHLRAFVILFRDGRYYHLIAKPILIIYSIGASAFRVRIIHRHDQRFALGMCPIIHGIQVREELMPQFQAFAHDPFGHGIVVPRFFIDKQTAGRVQPIDRREYAVLHPARCQVVIPVSVKMAADIMAPPSVTDVG